MSKQLRQKHLFRVLMLSLIIILLGGGAALLYQLDHGSSASHASSDNVVGPPSLPASYVDEVFRRLGSPMVGTGQAVEAASRAQNIDDAFALAVWWTETNDGAAGVGLADRNPGSVRGSTGYPSAYDGYTIYPSFTAAVTYWFSMLKRVYIDRGLTTVSSISHPYVGTSTSNLWAGKVIALMQTYHSEAPPIPTPTPTVAPNTVRNAKDIANRQALQPQTPAQFQAQNQPAPNQKVVHTDLTLVEATNTGLNAGTKNLLVFLCLLVALAMGTWAWRMNRRYADSTRLAGLMATNEIQDKLRKGIQQPVSLSGITGHLGNLTGEHAFYTPNTETLVAAGSLMSAYGSEERFSAGAYLPAQQNAFAFPQVPQLEFASTERLPTANTPVAEGSQSTPWLGAGLPGQADSFKPAVPGSFRRTQMLPSRATNVLPPVSGPTSNIWDQLQSLAGSPSLPPETITETWNQPQPVGAGASSKRSNGLLSRYRETQPE